MKQEYKTTPLENAAKYFCAKEKVKNQTYNDDINDVFENICEKGQDTTKHCAEICAYRDNFICTKEFDEELHEAPMHFTKEQIAWIKQFVNLRCEIAREQERKEKHNKYCPFCGKEIKIKCKE